jgi:AcrR family transcriptional regulator
MRRSARAQPVSGRWPRRKRPDHYHHGDLRRALLEEAIRTIQHKGVEQLTLRTVGKTLGVSRTALYRHFVDKQALLAAVGREGFRMLREALSEAMRSHGGGRAGFEAQGATYVRFAVSHPSHYRVMFGGFLEACDKDAEFVQEAQGAFQVLVDAIVEQQQAGTVRCDDPQVMATFVWSIVHGVSMLAIDGHLRGRDDTGEQLRRYAIDRIHAAIAV